MKVRRSVSESEPDQTVSGQAFGQLLRGPGVWELTLDGRESCLGSRLEAFEEIEFLEKQTQIGGQVRQSHGCMLPCESMQDN